MKKKAIQHLVFAFILFLGLVSTSFAQNYRLFNPEREAYFGTYSGPGTTVMHHALRFDSSSVAGADTSWFAFDIAEQDSDYFANSCFAQFHEEHWIGHELIERANGMWEIIYDGSWTLFIDPTAQLNDEWVFQPTPANFEVRAKITSHDTSTVLGSLDSVKTASLQAYNTLAGTPVAHPWNGFEIKMSKDHGMITGYQFKYYPDSTQALTLVGMDNPFEGKVDISYDETFDWEVGDEVHVHRDYYCCIGPNWLSNDYKIIYRIIGRTVLTNPDTVLYQIERCAKFENGSANGIFVSSAYDTVTFPGQFLYYDKMINYLPLESRAPVAEEQSVLIPYVNAYTNVLFHDGNFNDRVQKNVIKVIYADPPSGCMESMIFFGSGPLYYNYVEGVGGPFWFSDDGFDRDSQILVYFKKGNETWGTPFQCPDLLVNQEPQVPEARLQLFPNPANNLVRLQWTVSDLRQRLPGGEFILRNQLGQKVMKREIAGEWELNLEVAQLPRGLYFYEYKPNEAKEYDSQIANLSGKILLN